MVSPSHHPGGPRGREAPARGAMLRPWLHDRARRGRRRLRVWPRPSRPGPGAPARASASRAARTQPDRGPRRLRTPSRTRRMPVRVRHQAPRASPTWPTASPRCARRPGRSCAAAPSQIKIMASGGVASPTDPIWNLQYSLEEMRAIVEEAEGLAHLRDGPRLHARGHHACGGCGGPHHRARQPDRRGHRRAGCATRGAYLVPTLVTYFAIDELGPQARLPRRQPGAR